MFSKFISKNPKLFERWKSRLRDALPLDARTRAAVTSRFNKIHAKHFQDYVFIHIPKCGGTSVERALGLAVLNHDTARERFRSLGEKRWRNRLTFSVVRNPYTRLASSFFYLHHPEQREIAELQDEFRFWLFRWQVARTDNVLPDALQTQCWWLSDDNGTPLVDNICRIENINDDIKKIAATLGREINVQRLKENPLPIDYDDLYTPATREMVQDLYGEDFDRFGYER